MHDLFLIIHFLLAAICAGIVGVLGMTLLMWLVTRLGLTNADMVRAIGSVFTKSNESAMVVGVLLHTVSGVVFAMLYMIGFGLLGIHTGLLYCLMGVVFGGAHGFVMSFILVSTVAQHHPMEEFREAGPSVAAAHFAGHIVYGLLVGLVVAMSGLRLAG